MNEKERKILKFIRKRKIAFLGSLDDTGYPNVKAMLFPRKVDGLTAFYFSTNTSSKRVSQFQNNNKACVYFCNTLFFKGVMLKGTIEVLHDMDLKKELWRNGDTEYYPLGVTDPDYCILKFTITEKEFRSYRI